MKRLLSVFLLVVQQQLSMDHAAFEECTWSNGENTIALRHSQFASGIVRNKTCGSELELPYIDTFI